MEEGRGLFVPVVEPDRLHPGVDQIASHPARVATRQMMEEAFAQMRPRDPNFIEQFQTTGFDQRTWELALFLALRDLGFAVKQDHASPDFECTHAEGRFYVEATTANASMAGGEREQPSRSVQEHVERLRASLDVDSDEVAVRMGSALYSKAQRRYGDLPHVQGHPLALAIEPFFDAGALLRSETALVTYLYGRDFVFHEESEDVIVTYDEVKDHRGRTRSVRSGFFRDADHSAISAVIFSNSHTTAKFNRMGHLRGLAPRGTTLVRWGVEFDPDPGALEPADFEYEVGTRDENWADGLVILHNPAAAIPLGRDLFRGLTQVWEENDWLEVDMAVPHIYTSVTQTRSIIPGAGDTGRHGAAD